MSSQTPPALPGLAGIPDGSRAPAPKVWLELAEQTAAITHVGSPLLILAGAGSGKTTVMARRMAHLITEGGWEPEQILGLTFSNKAASNLRARAISELGPGTNVSVQTYHGFGASIVNANHVRLGFTRLPRLLDRAESWQLLYGALDAVTINHRKTGRLGSLINEALSLASSCADHLVTIETVRANCEELLGSGGPRLADNAKRALQYRLDLCRLAAAYAQAKKTYDCIDFSDQLALAAHVVANVPDVADELRHQYPVVLLDEYQDTNFAQRKLLELLYVEPSAEGGVSLAANVTAVGDDMQSIYGFRGAHLSNITNFEHHIPGAVERRLETNHRSGALVVELANYVQGKVPSARPKTLRVRDDAPPAKLTSFIGADDSSEAAEIAKQCLAIGAPWSEIAVLCRKRKVIPAIVSALKAAGVPVDVMGMGGLLARPEVVDLMAWLEIICAPTDSLIDSAVETEPENEAVSGSLNTVATGSLGTAEVDDQTWLGPDPSIALLRILQGPRFRIGMRDLGALGRSARKLAKNRQGDDRRVDLMAALVQTDSITELSAEAYGRCKQFVHIRSILRTLLGRSASERSIADVIDAIAQEVGLYRDVDTIGYENLLRFIDVAARFSPLSDRSPVNDRRARSGAPHIESSSTDDDDPLYREPPTVRTAMLSFLEYLQLVAESEDDPAEATQTGTDAVQIMSIHQAKGLEFDTVFLAGIAGTKKSSSIFPDERLPANGVTQAAVLPPWLQADGDPTVPPISHYKELKVLADAARQRANEEELRLLYVAVTRARKNLICSTGHWYPGPATAHGPSAFFDLLNDSKLFTPGKSEPAAKEDPAASLRKRRLDALNEKLSRKNRSQEGFAGSAGVSTGLFGEALPATSGRTKSRRLKPLPAPLLPLGTGLATTGSLNSSSSSEHGLASADLSAPGLSAPGLSVPGLSSPGVLTPRVPAQGLSITSLPVSALGVVAVCPRKYHWTYVLPLPRRRSPAAEFGTAVHTWIESGAGTNLEASDLEDPQSGVTTGLFPAPPSAGPDTGSTTQLFASLSDRVRSNYLATRFASLKPALAESVFSFTPSNAENATILSGRMDAVYVHDDGTVEIVDIKSGRAPLGDAAIASLLTDTAVQMAAYGLLALDAWGIKADHLRTTVCYLGGDEPVLHTTIWDESIATQQRELVGTHIAKAISDPNGVIPGPPCSYCDFNAFCEGAAQIRTKASDSGR